MEGIDFKRTGLEYLKKYRHILLIFLVGLFLMLIPEDHPQEPQIPEMPQMEEPHLQAKLGTILSQIEGAGKTEVLLTEASGSETYYQTDDDTTAGESTKDQRKNTVLISGTDRSETGLVRRIDPPVYQGAVVICQGADRATVRLSIVEAVANATGLSTDRITVLKMK